MDRFDFDAVYKKNRAEGRDGWHDRPYYAERRARAEAFLARNHAARGDTVLLLGCGAGNTVSALARLGFDVSGIDIAPEAVAWAQDRLARSGLTADLRVGNVVTLEPYPAQAFRFVFDDYCLQCVVGPERATCFSQVFRVLEPAGVFYAGSDRLAEPSEDAMDHADFDRLSRCVVRDGVRYSYLTRDGEFEQELIDAGFFISFSEHRVIPGGPSYHAGRQWVDAVKLGSGT
jgi:ubiquinone/menaquinone biosynthesis C-methylase UbiE